MRKGKKSQMIPTWIWFGIAASLIFHCILAEVDQSETEDENESDQMLEIPALGRSVRIGYMYNAQTNKFYNAHGFNVDASGVPTTSLQTTEKRKATTNTLSTGSFAERFRVLNIHGSTALRILTGKERLREGISRQLLKSDVAHGSVCSRKLRRSILHTYTTVVQDLQFFSNNTKELLDSFVLNNQLATHLVTSITWGASLAVVLESEELEVQASRAVDIVLQKHLKALKKQPLFFKTNDSDFNPGISVTLLEDISSGLEPPHTYNETQRLITQLPQLIKTTNINQGKGIPLSITLTPIKLLRDLKQSTEKLRIDKSPKISDDIVDDFVNIFDTLTRTENQVCEFQAKLQEQREQCQHPEAHLILENLLLKVSNSFNTFKSLLKEAFSKVQTGTSQVTKLSRLIQSYDEYEFEFCPANVNEELEKVLNLMKNMQFCNYFTNKYSTISYFGISQENLRAKIFESKDNIIYALFKTKIVTEEDTSKWFDNFNTFTNALNKPFNKLFLIDCTQFNFTECSTVNQTVIKQLVNGQFILHDVLEELNKAKKESLQSLRIPALGRNAKIGELFNFRNENFLGLTLLKENKVALAPIITARAGGNVQVYSIESEKLEDKFTALNVDTETGFSILGKIFSPVRSGAYLTSVEKDFSLYPVQSILHSYTFAVEDVQIKNSSFTDSIIDKMLLNTQKATHFVSKIEYGCNTIFTIVSQRTLSQEENGAFSEMKTKLKTILGRMRPELLFALNEVEDSVNETLPGTGLTPVLTAEESEEIESLMTRLQIRIEVYSDIQDENSNGRPIEIEGAGELKAFLENKYIPQLYFSRRSKGWPITYVLYPIRNLGPEIGFLSSSVTPSGSLANSRKDLHATQNILKYFETAEIQIDRLIKLVQEGSDYATDEDKQAMLEIEKSYNTELTSFEQSLKNIITTVKSGEVNSSALENYLTVFKSQNHFGENGEFVLLDKMNSFIEKYDMWSNRLKGSNIKYVGRGNNFNNIFTESTSESSNIYLLFYKLAWTKDPVAGAAWRRCSLVFFGPLSSSVRQEEISQDRVGVANRNETTKFLVVDCDFGHPGCEDLTESKIHEYRNGRLKSNDFIQVVEQEESTVQRKVDAISEKVLANDKFLNNSLSSVYTDLEVLRDEIDESLRNLTRNIETMPFHTQLEKLESDVASVAERVTDVVESDCGGIISIPTTKNSYLLQYKLNRTYDPKENCLWTVENAENFERRQLTLEFDLISHGFEGNTGLYVYKWNRDTNLTSENIASSKKLELSAEGLYLSFTSDDETSPEGTGFLLRITVTHSEPRTYGSNLFFRTSPGSHAVSSYKNEDQISVVVNSKKPITFGVDSIYSERNNDYLILHEIIAEGKFRQGSRLSGKLKNPFEFRTSNPILAVFTSDVSTTGAGFKISWA